MRMTLIHNPKAGGQTHHKDELVRLLRAAGHEVDYESSHGNWRAALTHASECVAAAGGDGTIGKVAKALAGTGVPIVVLPLGTANNVALALGVSAIPIPELIAGIPHASRRSVDLGTANGPWGRAQFLESVGAGLLSETIADIDHGESGFVNELDDPDSRVTAAAQVFEAMVKLAAQKIFQDMTVRNLNTTRKLHELMQKMGARVP